MKLTLAVLGTFFIMNAHATIDLAKETPPSATEISKSRSCWKNLEEKGCGKYEEDPERFRSCMSGILETLDDNCQKMMKDLYGSK